MKKNTNPKSKNTETGRSIVEMLGVLAIMGVLTIGGNIGYNYAMNRHRANVLLEGASRRAIIVATRFLGGRKLDRINMAEVASSNETSGGTFDHVALWEGKFGLGINGVSEAVCQDLIQMRDDSGMLQAITTQTNNERNITLDDCEAQNNLYLVYDINIKGASSLGYDAPSGVSSVGGSPAGPSGGSVEPVINCGIHGTLGGDGKCWCKTGWGGPDCMVGSGSACSGHGYWNVTSCECNAGWSGASCNTPLPCEAWEDDSTGSCVCDNAKCVAHCPAYLPGEEGDAAYALSSGGCNLGGGDVVFGDCYCNYPCFPGDTLITLADGRQKRADEITYDDELLVWNFDEGHFDKAKPLWIKERDIAMAYNVIRFSNGVELKTIDDHRIFNREKGAFTYPMLDNENTPVGTHTFTANGEWVTLESKDVVHEKVAYYNIITDRHMNCFANGILTSCRLNNIYPIKDMKFVKDDRELIPYSVYAELPRRWYDGLRLAEQPVEVNRDNSVTYHGTTIVEYVRHLMGKQQVGDVSLLEKVA